MREILEFVLATIHRQRALGDLPFGVAGTLGAITETVNKLLLGLLPAEYRLYPRPGRTAASRQCRLGKAASDEGRTLAGLGLTPESIENIVPTYLYRYRKYGQFADERVV